MPRCWPYASGCPARSIRTPWLPGTAWPAGPGKPAAEGADLVLHLTEWSDYRAIDPAALARVVAHQVIIDARCCLDTELWRSADWSRPRPRPPLTQLGGLHDVG